MLKYLVTFLIGLLNIYSFGCYFEKYSVIQINTFSENKVASVFNTNGDIINASELQFNKLNGYPAINGTFDAGPYFAYHKNRFLAKHENEYCLIDTNCQIIIDFCDTIEAIFFGPEIWFDESKCDVFLKNPGYGYHVYYQAIKNGATFLYNNSGEKIFANSYTGLLYGHEGHYYKVSEYYYTRNLDYSGFGLLDKLGNVILANNFGPLYPAHRNHCEMPSNYYGSYQSGIFNIQTREWELFDSAGFGFGQICNHIYLFQEDDKYGLFDIVEGIILPAEYDTIILPKNYYDNCWSGIKTGPLMLQENNKYGLFDIDEGIILPTEYDTIIIPKNFGWEGIKPDPFILKKGNQEKSWNVPKKYWYIKEEKK